MNESTIARFCGLMIIAIFLLAVWADKCEAQEYMIDTTIVDSVLYEGNKLPYEDYSDTQAEWCMRYGEHDWVYSSSKNLRICQYCYRWEIVHVEKRRWLSKYEILVNKILENK